MKFKKYLSAWLVCLLFIACTGGRVARAKAADSIRVLIVTGMDIPAHDWSQTTGALQEELSKDTRMKVGLLKDPYKLEAAPLSQYDVVFLNFNNYEKPDPSQKGEENLRQFVAAGGGLVVMHFASGAFVNWPEFTKLAGKIWDRKNTHDPRGPFSVEIVDTLHPITKGMKEFETDDELYVCLTGDQPVQLLARARSKVDNKYHPMAFALTYRKGRVFHTTLGHDARAVHIPGTAELIRHGVAWAAGRAVKE